MERRHYSDMFEIPERRESFISSPQLSPSAASRNRRLQPQPQLPPQVEDRRTGLRCLLTSWIFWSLLVVLYLTYKIQGYVNKFDPEAAWGVLLKRADATVVYLHDLKDLVQQIYGLLQDYCY